MSEFLQWQDAEARRNQYTHFYRDRLFPLLTERYLKKYGGSFPLSGRHFLLTAFSCSRRASVVHVGRQGNWTVAKVCGNCVDFFFTIKNNMSSKCRLYIKWHWFEDRLMLFLLFLSTYILYSTISKSKTRFSF